MIAGNIEGKVASSLLVEPLRNFLLAFLVLLLAFGVAVRLARRLYHFPIPSLLVGLIDNPFRRRIQSPKKIAGRFDVRYGMNVVEVGPGAGIFTIEVARRVAPSGIVCAIDISLKAVKKLRAKTERERVMNVAAVVASAHDLPIVSGSVDRVFMVTVLGEIPEPRKALAEFRRTLRMNGVLSISEFVLDPDYPLRRTVVRWCHSVGFTEISRFGTLLEYTVNFRPTKQP